MIIPEKCRLMKKTTFKGSYAIVIAASTYFYTRHNYTITCINSSFQTTAQIWPQSTEDGMHNGYSLKIILHVYEL